MPREVSGDDLWIPLVSGSQVVHLLFPHLPVANGLLSSSHFRKLRRAIRDSGGISHFCSTIQKRDLVYLRNYKLQKDYRRSKTKWATGFIENLIGITHD